MTNSEHELEFTFAKKQKKEGRKQERKKEARTERKKDMSIRTADTILL